MTRVVNFFVLSGLFFIFAVGFCAADDVCPASGWEKVVEKEGITVYERALPGRDVKEFEAEAVLECNPMQVIALLEDREAASSWFPHCRIFKQVGDISPYEGLFYSVCDFPWPMRPRYAFLQSTRSYAQASKSFTIRYWSVDRSDCDTTAEKMVRIPSLEGVWTVTELGENRTRVTSRLYVDPDTFLPAWLFNPFFRDAAYQAFENMRKMVAGQRYMDQSGYKEIMGRFRVISGATAMADSLL